MKTRFKLIAAVYILFIKDNQILLSRRFNTGYNDGKYSLVAGHIEGEESLATAAAREAKEEVGVEIDPKDLLLKHTIHQRQDDERLEFFFEVKKWKGEIKNMEPNKCDELRWFLLNKLPENTIPHIQQAIENSVLNIPYSEYWRN